MKKNQDKPKEQPISRLVELRHQVTKFEILEDGLEWAEKTLRESEGKHEELAESISDVFFAFDNNLGYTYWNKASQEFTVISAKNTLSFLMV